MDGNWKIRRSFTQNDASPQRQEGAHVQSLGRASFIIDEGRSLFAVEVCPLRDTIQAKAKNVPYLEEKG